MPSKRKEQELKEIAEQEAIEQQRREGAAALAQDKAEQAARTDEERANDEALAAEQQAAAEAEEAARIAEEQAAADKLLAELAAEAAEEGLDDFSPDVRLLKAGTVLHLNGEPVMLPVDALVELPGAADEQHFVSVLAREPKNFALNADLLRLVYSPMNGTPLPLESQRLELDEMTEAEQALFAAPPRR